MSCPDKNLCQEQIAFQGRIVAGATHEFQNHLAVIKEYSGLINDLLNGKQADGKRVIKRCSEITATINERANRAAVLADALNRFAHRGDAAVSAFRINDAVKDLIVLLQRFASQHNIALEAKYGRRLAEVINNPSLLQYLVFLLTAPLIESLGEGGKVTLSTSAGKDKSPEIEIKAEGTTSSLADTGPAPEIFKECLNQLAGNFSLDTAKKKIRKYTLSIPSLAETRQIR